MKAARLLPMTMAVLLLLISAAAAEKWQCDDATIPFLHRPSNYYGSGEYFADCPEKAVRIRCYHYHRHWICEKGGRFFWDRNLESAARSACGCPLPKGMAPSAPAVSKEPETRFHDIPAR